MPRQLQKEAADVPPTTDHGPSSEAQANVGIEEDNEEGDDGPPAEEINFLNDEADDDCIDVDPVPATQRSAVRVRTEQPPTTILVAATVPSSTPRRTSTVDILC